MKRDGWRYRIAVEIHDRLVNTNDDALCSSARRTHPNRNPFRRVEARPRPDIIDADDLAVFHADAGIIQEIERGRTS